MDNVGCMVMVLFVMAGFAYGESKYISITAIICGTVLAVVGSVIRMFTCG